MTVEELIQKTNEEIADSYRAGKYSYYAKIKYLKDLRSPEFWKDLDRDYKQTMDDLKNSNLDEELKKAKSEEDRQDLIDDSVEDYFWDLYIPIESLGLKPYHYFENEIFSCNSKAELLDLIPKLYTEGKKLFKENENKLIIDNYISTYSYNFLDSPSEFTKQMDWYPVVEKFAKEYKEIEGAE